MAGVELELNPVDFVTIGTIGPKGQRIFHLQAGKERQLVSLVIEKEQAWALSEAINDLIDDLDNKQPEFNNFDMAQMDMDLREPIRPMFRVAQMGIGYDEDQAMIVLVAQEMVALDGEEDPGVVRLWCSRDQMRALSIHAIETVEAGRANPKQNGRLVYYWT
ncbi:MAG: DUF3090 family protein [Chloroflexota bacterium]